MRTLNEVLRFVLEMLALAAFGYSASQLTDSPVRFGLGGAAVLAAATAWGVLVAPKSSHRLRDPVRLMVEIVFFIAAGCTLLVVGAPWVGLALAVAGVANAVLLRLHRPVLGALE